MRKRWLVLAAVGVVAAAATAIGVAATSSNFGTHLKGRYEVPMRATNGQGQAIFRVADDGQSVDYKLIASNIDNVIMAHIHLVPVGLDPTTNNGPIVQWLYPGVAPPAAAPGSGRHDGVLAEGTFTAASLVGPLAGHPLSDLLAAIADGRAYVNVHTDDGVAPPNTGAGDFPGGEIRGLLGN